MIEVKNLIRKYGEFTAVNDVSFSIPKGQIIGLLGHNGAGKTTTLKMLTGYMEATKGEIEIAGMDIKKDCLKIQQLIGYLPENSPLYPEMTVVEYLDYVAEMRGIDESQKAAAIKEAVAATQLEPKANSKISTLSKGYKQRVGVAQAIIHKPEILILDEPTNGLDPTQILAMRKLIKELSSVATVILSTHIMQEVEAICDRVLIILDGRLVVDSLMGDLQKGNTLTVSLKEEFSQVKDTLTKIPGVKDISPTTPLNGINRYVIEGEKDDLQVAAYVAKAVVDKGWDLYGLSKEHRDLETVFKEVNKVSTKGGAHV